MGKCICPLIYIILVGIQKNKKQKNKLTGAGAGRQRPLAGLNGGSAANCC